MLAVGFIIFGGITYMTTDSFSGKSEGKEHLTNALGGLIFLIGGYLIFIQINPNILNIDFSTASGRVEIIAQQMEISLESLDNADNCEALKADFRKKGYNEERCSGQIKTSAGAISWASSIVGTIAGIGGATVGSVVGPGGTVAGGIAAEVGGAEATMSLAEWANADKNPKEGCNLIRDIYRNGKDGLKFETSPCIKCSVAGGYEDYCTYIKTGRTSVDCKNILEKQGYKCMGSCLGNDCEDKEKSIVAGKYLSAGLSVDYKTCQIGNGSSHHFCVKGTSLVDARAQGQTLTPKITWIGLGGDLCYDDRSCDVKLRNTTYENCIGKYIKVAQEKCGYTDIGCKNGNWKYKIYIPSTCKKR